MKYYSEQHMAPKDMETFRRVRELIDYIRSALSCHELCDHIADKFKGEVRVERGYFCGHYEHSWLITASGRALIDAYPVAGAAPFIVMRDKHSPWIKLYTPCWFDEVYLFRKDSI